MRIAFVLPAGSNWLPGKPDLTAEATRMGLPGETADPIRGASDFALCLNLDDMIITKFTSFPGIPIGKEIGSLGKCTNDRPLTNRLHFAFVPRAVDPRQQLDQRCNWHVLGFCRSKGWRKNFIRRLWQHRESHLRLVYHLPAFWPARSAFAGRQNRATP
ncbi:MAG: hypothetical protein PVG78_04770 [Desulfobacterales bacterium]|jgi:hypothetical protein